MWNNGHDAYLQGQIFSADPIELIHLLYQAAIEAVRDARHQLAQGEIGGRSKAINHACQIVMELRSSLDLERGGEIARRLGPLYDYLLGRLLEANLQQSDAILVEILALLATLSEAWEAVRSPALPEPAATGAWSREPGQESYASHGWSL